VAVPARSFLPFCCLTSPSLFCPLSPFWTPIGRTACPVMQAPFNQLHHFTSPLAIMAITSSPPGICLQPFPSFHCKFFHVVFFAAPLSRINPYFFSKVSFFALPSAFSAALAFDLSSPGRPAFFCTPFVSGDSLPRLILFFRPISPFLNIFHLDPPMVSYQTVHY